tara:strand:- start:184 stop:792 length:609 start_codon:yes stop_codon:yes gene_type:complete
MAEYTLTNSAAVVDASIQKVANATTTPTDGSPLMVTSGGVKNYVDTALGVFDGKTITTEATGIENTDNDTSIPTSAAVKDYVSNQVFGTATVNFSGTLATNQNGSFPASILSSNIEAVDNGTVINLPLGNYIYSLAGSLPTLAYRQEIFLNGFRLAVGHGWSDSRPLSPNVGFLSNISYVNLYGQVYGTTITVSNILTLIKV